MRMTLIVPKEALKVASLQDPNLAWPPCPLGWYKNCFNLPSLTSCSKWLHKVLQSSVVCPRSWCYWQWKLWLRFVGSPPILFGHLKNGLFLIFSKTWCTGSQNTVNHLSSGRPRMPRKISSGPVIVVFVQPEIPPILKDNLSFSFPLLLVLLDSLILFNSVHELTYTVNKFPDQRFPQTMLSR